MIILKRTYPNVSNPVWRAKSIMGKPKEKTIIINSIVMYTVKQFFIRVIAVVAANAPLAAPAMKDATRIPIHEKT